MKTAVLGASQKPERFSNKAVRRLQQHGHEVIPVHPVLEEIEGLPVVHSLDQLPDDIHTLSIYIGPRHITQEIGRIVNLNPRRVIMNPGTESHELKKALDDHNISWLEACTLVMLDAGDF